MSISPLVMSLFFLQKLIAFIHIFKESAVVFIDFFSSVEFLFSISLILALTYYLFSFGYFGFNLLFCFKFPLDY